MGSPSCRCLQNLATLLEELECCSQTTELVRPDRDLVVLKRSIGQCIALFDCDRCDIATQNVMLVIVVCEKVGRLYCRTAENFYDQVQHTAPANLRRMTVGEYVMESAEELQCVVGALLVLQARQLLKLLCKIRSLGGMVLKDIHMVMLNGTEERLVKATRLLRRAEPE